MRLLASTLFIVAILFTQGVLASPLQAEEVDEIVCAAVLPCDQSGQVLPQYRGGVCGEQYERQCASEQANQIAEELVQCEQARGADQAQFNRLTRKVRQLKRRLRVRSTGK